jgi:flagellar basal-body rod protein FlgB
MDWSNAAPFGPIKQRLAWLGQRQQVLARNIANSDTPGYVPHDLKPLRFNDALSRSRGLAPATTDAQHMAGTRRPAAFAEQKQRDPAETLPNGNAVDLEEQMAKLNETQVAHKLATQLYKKYLGMIRMVAGARG